MVFVLVFVSVCFVLFVCVFPVAVFFLAIVCLSRLCLGFLLVFVLLAIVCVIVIVSVFVTVCFCCCLCFRSFKHIGTRDTNETVHLTETRNKAETGEETSNTKSRLRQRKKNIQNPPCVLYWSKKK